VKGIHDMGLDLVVVASVMARWKSASCLSGEVPPCSLVFFMDSMISSRWAMSSGVALFARNKHSRFSMAFLTSINSKTYSHLLSGHCKWLEEAAGDKDLTTVRLPWVASKNPMAPWSSGLP